MAFASRMELASASGARLNVLHQPAEGVVRGVVQINHGMAEHAARYARFARALAAQGFHVHAQDHRGHGATTAPDAARGHFGTPPAGDMVMADLDAVHDQIARAHPGLPVILFGHSMGSMIALDYMGRRHERLAGAALWNAAFDTGPLGHAARAVVAVERMRLGSDVPSRILPKLTFRTWARSVPEARTDCDWLSHDATEVDAYVADPLCGFDVTLATWQACFGFIFAGAGRQRLAAMPKDFPINLVGGDEDPATNGGKAVTAFAERLRALGFSNLTSTVYAGTRHEGLNDLKRDLITADFVAWAKRVVA